MPRTKGGKNHTNTDFDAQIAKLLEEGLSKTVAQIEELKQGIKSLREGLKPQKAEIKQTEKKSQSWRLRRLPLRRKLPKLLRRLRLKLC